VVCLLLVQSLIVKLVLLLSNKIKLTVIIIHLVAIPWKLIVASSSKAILLLELSHLLRSYSLIKIRLLEVLSYVHEVVLSHGLESAGIWGVLVLSLAVIDAGDAVDLQLVLGVMLQYWLESMDLLISKLIGCKPLYAIIFIKLCETPLVILFWRSYLPNVLLDFVIFI
jgi:hypothetical protein